jgi:hypothetical protein
MRHTFRAFVAALLAVTSLAVPARGETTWTVGVTGPYPLTGSFTPEVGILGETLQTSVGLRLVSVDGGGDSFLLYNRTMGTVWEQGSTKVRVGGTLGLLDTADTDLILAPLVHVASSVSARLEVFGEAAPLVIRAGDDTTVGLLHGSIGVMYVP